MRAAPKPLPSLPRQVVLPAGPYKVVRGEIEPGPNEQDQTVLGFCDVEARVITIKPGISRPCAWLTFEHEKMHAILHDAGVQLSRQKEEDVCNAVGNYRVYEMQR
jgi:hypothetical protein